MLKNIFDRISFVKPSDKIHFDDVRILIFYLNVIICEQLVENLRERLVVEHDP